MKKFFFILLSLCFGEIFSQSDSLIILKEVSIVSDKPLIQTAASIMKIDSVLMSQKITNNLSSLLQEGTDVFVKSAGKGAMSTISMRGMTASHTTVLWNNIPFNSPILGAADLSQIPVVISDEINLIYGSSSASYNKNSLSGILDLKSYADWNDGFRFKYAGEIASFYSFDNSLILKYGKKKFQTVTKVFENYSKNNFKYFNNDISNPKEERRENADYLRYGAEQEFYYKLNSFNVFSAKLWFQKSDRGVPGLTTNESGFNNHINRENNNQFLYSVDYKGSNGDFSFSAFHGGNLLYSNYSSSNQVNTFVLDIIKSYGETTSLYNNITVKYNLLKKTEFTVKIDYNFSKIKTIEEIRNQGFDTNRNEICLLTSVFSEPFKNFRTGLILKQDYADRKFSPFLPLFFVEYKFLNHFAVKSSVAKNYSLPSLSDLYYNPGGNPDLKPERANVVDGGLSFFINKNNFETNFDLNANYNIIRDWIMWKPTAMGYWVPSNIEKVETYGTNLSNNTKIKVKKIQFAIFASFSYTISHNISTKMSAGDASFGRQLPYIPVYSANFRGIVDYKGFWLCYKWSFFSERYTDSAAELFVLSSLPKYYMNAISLGKNFQVKNLKFSIDFGIDNLFNEKYYSLLWQPMPGINFFTNLIIQYK